MPNKSNTSPSVPIIRRKNIMLASAALAVDESPTEFSDIEFLALIVNSSQEMAKEITLQLTLAMPGCSIMYAPSIEIAKWILKRKKIDLVVSSSVLPDGSYESLKAQLDSLESPPDLIVVGNSRADSSQKLSRYNLVSQKPFVKRTEIIQSRNAKLPAPELNKAVKTLGADIRNDLNNPLQEIVAMVFVAKSGKAAITTEKALEAIDKVAKSMATIVNGLEDKILKVVEGGPAQKN